MSHYTVAVLTYTDDPYEVDELLAPYWEEREVEKYIHLTKDEVIKEAKAKKEDWIKELHKYDAEQLITVLTSPKYEMVRQLISCTSDEDFLNYKKEIYESDMDRDGNVWSTYNPDSKWDWYQVGGRWPDSLYDWKHGYWCDSLKLADWDMNYDDEHHNMFECTYAVVTPNGEWHAPGEMGWFAMSSETPEEYARWKARYKNEMLKADPDWYITIVDCHI